MVMIPEYIKTIDEAREYLYRHGYSVDVAAEELKNWEAPAVVEEPVSAPEPEVAEPTPAPAPVAVSVPEPVEEEEEEEEEEEDEDWDEEDEDWDEEDEE